MDLTKREAAAGAAAIGLSLSKAGLGLASPYDPAPGQLTLRALDRAIDLHGGAAAMVMDKRLRYRLIHGANRQGRGLIAWEFDAMGDRQSVYSGLPIFTADYRIDGRLPLEFDEPGRTSSVYIIGAHTKALFDTVERAQINGARGGLDDSVSDYLRDVRLHHELRLAQCRLICGLARSDDAVRIAGLQDRAVIA